MVAIGQVLAEEILEVEVKVRIGVLMEMIKEEEITREQAEEAAVKDIEKGDKEDAPTEKNTILR